MASFSSPYGLRPTGKMTGRDGGAIASLPLTVNNATAIFYGDPIHLASGVITPCTASPTTSQNANTPVGVFVGCRYTDPVRGLVCSQYLPANAVNSGFTNIIIEYCDDPNQRFVVQADGPVGLNKIGQNAALTNFGNGSTATGNSKVQLQSSSIATTATLAVKIVDLVNSTSDSPAGSVPGDAFTDVIVVWNQGVHAYENQTGA